MKVYVVTSWKYDEVKQVKIFKSKIMAQNWHDGQNNLQLRGSGLWYDINSYEVIEENDKN